MMTTSRVFGINSPAPSPPPQPEPVAVATVDVEKNALIIEQTRQDLLQKAVAQFLNKEITQKQLDYVKSTLK